MVKTTEKVYRERWAQFIRSSASKSHRYYNLETVRTARGLNFMFGDTRETCRAPRDIQTHMLGFQNPARHWNPCETSKPLRVSQTPASHPYPSETSRPLQDTPTFARHPYLCENSRPLRDIQTQTKHSHARRSPLESTRGLVDSQTPAGHPIPCFYNARKIECN